MSPTINEDGSPVLDFDLERILDLPLRAEAAGDEQTVRAVVLYDPLDPTDREIVDLVWAKGKTLAAYLDGLPEDGDWSAFVGAREIQRGEWAQIELAPLDTVIVGLVPNKTILPIVMMVALLAVSVFQPELAPLASYLGVSTGLIAGGLSLAIAVGGYLISSMLADKTSSTTSSSSTQSSSYGLDGPKNTSAESVVVPEIYGTMRVGGNKAAIYIENWQDALNQTLFMMFVIGEGEIDGVSNVEINGQPIENFQSAIWDWRAGTQGQLPIQWFSETITPFNVGVKTTTSHFIYNTALAVDRVRVDLTFPNGLYTVDSSSGKLKTTGMELGATYRKLNPDGSLGPVFSFQAGEQWNRIDANNGNTNVACSGLRLTVEVSGNAGEALTPYTVSADFMPTGAITPSSQYTGNFLSESALNAAGGKYAYITQDWNSMGVETGVISNIQQIQPDGSVIFAGGKELRVFEVTGFSGEALTFRVNGGVVVAAEALYATTLNFFGDQRTALRFSFTSPPLERSRYQMEFWRGSNESTDTNTQNSLYITDINEVQDDLINYVNTAHYGVQVRLGSDLNSEPTVTVLVRGKKVSIYDRNGNVSTVAWSDNPADIALDVMLNPRHRFAFNTTRIDFPAFDNWRNYCAQQSLKFNGTFDQTSNVWDALMEIMRVGRGSPVLQGLKWSVLIEAPADPVMMFTQDHMITGSFTSSWTGRKNRANFVEVQYYESTEGYKQRSVFALDETYIAQGEALVQSTINLRGVTDATQATKEAWLQLNLNRYLVQSVQFDAWLQAMGCIVGDVILLQHDMPQWGYAARITEVTTFGGFPLATIDSEVPFNHEADWRILLLRGTAQLAQGQVSAVSGKTIQVSNFTAASITSQDSALIAYGGGANVLNPTPITGFASVLAAFQRLGIDRVLIGGKDYRVTDWSALGSNVIITSDENFTTANGALVEFYKNDLMCEGLLTTPPPGKQVLIGSWLNGLVAAPQVNDLVMLGQVDKWKKPFRVTKISYKDDHTRTINALEYNDSVYGDHAQPTPNYSALPLKPYQVGNLVAQQISNQLQGGAMQYLARFSWDRPLNDPRGYAGAKIYLSLNHAQFQLLGDAPNPVQSWDVPAQLGDLVMLKVVAFERTQEIADYASAPIAAIEIGTFNAKPALVTGLVATGGTRQIGLRWNVINDDYVKFTQIWESADTNLAHAVLLWQGNQNFFVHTGLIPNQTCNYWARTYSITNEPGDFVGPASATTTRLIADDIQNGILDTSKFANSIDFVSLVDGVPTTLSQTNGSKLAFNTQTGDLYRWNGLAFTKAIQPADVPGVALASDVNAINSALANNYLTAAQTNAAIAAMQAGALTQDQIDQIKAATTTGLLSDASIYAANIVGFIGDAQIAAINAAKIGGKITTTQITDGAITTPLLGADAVVASKLAADAVMARNIKAGEVVAGKLAAGAVVAGSIAANAVTAGTVDAGAISAREIAAGAVTTTKLAVGSPTNMIANHSFIYGAEDWSFAISGGGTLAGSGAVVNTALDPAWRLQGSGTGFINCAGLGLNQYMYAYTAPNAQLGVPVQPGQWYVAQAQVMPHRCAAFVQLQFLDGAGTVVSNNSSTRTFFAQPTVGSYLANYQKAWVCAQAPSTAGFARLVVLGINDGGGDLGGASQPYLFFTQTSLGQSWNQVTEAPLWDAGGVTTIGGGVVQTNALLARHIAAGQISTTHLAVGSGNVITNSCCMRSVSGWDIHSWGTIGAANFDAFTLKGDTETMGFPAWKLAGFGTGMATWNNSTAIDGNGGIYGAWAPGGVYQNMPVTAGKKYQGAILIQAHRCQVRLDIIWMDGTGAYLSETDGTLIQPNAQAAGTSEAQYARLTVLGTAPVGAVTCYLRWIAFGVTQSFPYVFFTKAMLSEAPPNAAEVGQWQPGGVTLIDGGVIRTNSIEADHLQVDSVSANALQANSVTFGKVAAGAIHADQIAANQIRATHLAADFVLASNAQFGNAVIDSAQIRDLSVLNQKIAGGAVTASNWGSATGGTSATAIAGVAVPPGGSASNGVLLIWRTHLLQPVDGGGGSGGTEGAP